MGGDVREALVACIRRGLRQLIRMPNRAPAMVSR
jgi:hypothetical protein